MLRQRSWLIEEGDIHVDICFQRCVGCRKGLICLLKENQNSIQVVIGLFVLFWPIIHQNCILAPSPISRAVEATHNTWRERFAPRGQRLPAVPGNGHTRIFLCLCLPFSERKMLCFRKNYEDMVLSHV